MESPATEPTMFHRVTHQLGFIHIDAILPENHFLGNHGTGKSCLLLVPDTARVWLSNHMTAQTLRMFRTEVRTVIK